MSFFEYLNNFNVNPTFLLVGIILIIYCVIQLLKELLDIIRNAANKMNSIKWGDTEFTFTGKLNEESVNSLIKGREALLEEEKRKQKEDWYRTILCMESDINLKLKCIKVWKRSNPSGQFTGNVAEEACQKGVSEYNSMVAEYVAFCKSINYEPKFMFITDMYNKGEDFEYSTELFGQKRRKDE